MSSYNLKLPAMGESVSEAIVTSWLKNVGDTVLEGDVILSVATDKVDNDIPSEVSGILAEQRCVIDEVVRVGQVLAIMDIRSSLTKTNDITTASSVVVDNTPIRETPPKPATIPIREQVAMPIEDEIQKTIQIPTIPLQQNTKPISPPSPVYTGRRFYSPLIQSMAKKKGVALSELDNIVGTGDQGRLTKIDFLSYLSRRAKGDLPEQSTEVIEKSKNVVKQTQTSDQKKLPIDRVRKLIAAHMTESLRNSAHVQTFVEADVSNLVAWRNKVKDDFQRRYEEKLTYTPLFLEVIAKALQEYPMLNNAIEDDYIVVNEHIHIGMATALPNGNLIVPVIKHVDRLELPKLVKTVNNLAQRARDEQLKPDETRGGTYTFTNIGGFGSLMGTPIINQPQLGILAFGVIQRVPAVGEDDNIVIRDKMYLSHSYDHRIIDGALGGLFVKKVAELLTSWSVKREI